VVKRRKNKTATQAIIDAQEASLAHAKAEIAERLARAAPMARKLNERFKQQRQESSVLDRAVSRMIRVSQGLDPVPRKKKRQQAVGRRGKPPIYKLEDIRAIAEKYAKTDFDQKFETFCKNISDRLTEAKIDEPGNTRFKELLKPIYKREKDRREKSLSR
jgi:hypothetical protein